MLPGIATIFYFLEIWKRTDCYHCLSPEKSLCNGHNPLVFLFPSYHELRNTPEVFVLNRHIYHEQRPKESDMLIKFTATARNRNALSNCRHKILTGTFLHTTHGLQRHALMFLFLFLSTLWWNISFVSVLSEQNRGLLEHFLILIFV